MKRTINFFYELDFELQNENAFTRWLDTVVSSEGMVLDEVNFIFCNDTYLHKINLEFLNHDTYTDIISFDNSQDGVLSGDIFISTERVKYNAGIFGVLFIDELKRVMVHGILHFCGYKDKSESEAGLMRQKEEEKIKMFHVEQ